MINILYVYMKYVYFIICMEWVFFVVNIFLNKIYMVEVDEILFFKIFKYIIIKVLISNVECVIKIWYILSILEWDVCIKIRKYVVKLLFI